MSAKAERARVAAVGAGAILLWSGTAIANKVAVGQIDPLTAGVLRSMLAGFLGAGIAVGARLRRPVTGVQRRLLLLSGLASFAAWPMILSLGLGWTSASRAALIMATLPVTTALIGFALERRIPRPGWWVGISACVVGATLLILQRSGEGSPLDQGGALGDVVILSGTVVCALGYVAGGRLSEEIGTWATTFWGLAAALLVLVPAFALLMHRTAWDSVGWAGWGAIAYMAILSSVVGYAGWFWALGRGGISRIATFQFLQPVLTLALAALLIGEQLTPPLLLSAATILSGTAVAQHQARPR